MYKSAKSGKEKLTSGLTRIYSTIRALIFDLFPPIDRRPILRIKMVKLQSPRAIVLRGLFFLRED